MRIPKKAKKEAINQALRAWSSDTFCTEFYAVDENGNSIMPYENKAVQWCVIGILTKTIPNSTMISDILHDFVTRYRVNVSIINDKLGYHHVVDMLEHLY